MTRTVKLTERQVSLILEGLDTVTFANSDLEFVKEQLRRSLSVVVTVPKNPGIRF